MAKEMLINVSEGEECRIALLDDGKLEELYMERTSSTSHVGNIYKGKVTNVEPSIQAAFVDFGLGRNGFLHISDLMPTYFGRKGEDIVETVGKKMARRDRPPIQRCLRRGDEIVVQIIKEGIGTKGPTLSTYLSIPGRILVMMPGMASKGVSRKIEDDAERRRLRQILEALDPPDDCGFIIRTAGVGKTKGEIERDLQYLARLWETLKKRRDSVPAPVELYTEGDLVTRTVRDLFTADVDRIVIDSKDVAKRVKDVIKLTSPRTKNRVDVYEDPIPLFHKYNIEREIELMYSRHVPLPSGGSLVIDSTEAIVAIDVNSGKFRDHSDAEMTAFKTDMEAADEIARQLRLRDLGGVIICDFIDLRYERHRRELETHLHELLKRDRAKTKMLRMSQFGIIEMTRQRMRPSFKRAVYFDCPHCKGAGLVKTPESMSIDVMRRIAIAVHDQRVTRVELAVCPDVSFYLQNRKRGALAGLENETGKHILVRADQALGLDEMKLELFDQRDGLVMIEGLTGVDSPPHRTQLSTRPHGGPQGGRGGRFDGRKQIAGQRRPPAGGGRDRHQGRGQSQGRGRGGDFVDDDHPDAEERMELTEAAYDDRDEERADEGQDEGVDNGAAVAEARRDDRPRDGGHDRAGRNDRGDQRGRHEQGGRHDSRGDRPNQSGRNDRGGPGGPRDRAAVPIDNRGPRVDERAPAGGNGGDDQGGGQRRRRRRRGRRGRGRGRDNQDGAQQGGHPLPVNAQGREGNAHDRPQADWTRDEQEGDETAGRAQASEMPDDDRERDARFDERYDGRSEDRRDGRRGDEPEELVAADSRGSDELAEESAEEPAPPPMAEVPTEQTEPMEDSEARKGRRRGGRGRGGRGRGRGKKADEVVPVAKAEAPPAVLKTPAAEGETAPKRRRGSRGGRGRGRKQAAAAEEPGGGANGDAAAATPPAPSAPASVPSPAAGVTRTGSTDRHLMSNEIEETPVMHEPVRRPHSVRDLDHIPEEFD